MKSLYEKIKTNPLGGRAIQALMAPISRGQFHGKSFNQAAVAILLFEREGQCFFPLIRRTRDNGAHSGQMALPGGGTGPCETAWQAALRESKEEVGAEKLSFLRELTVLEVPISGYRVTPFVVKCQSTPKWVCGEGEVEQIFEVPLDELISHREKYIADGSVRNIPNDAPYFLLCDQKVWGATAMILSEFRHLLL